ncbi:MAG TPA: ABC transporter ATP-binding protein [Polyangia bacterium]|jgi:sodium transport system ATP-binding protein|nr:ABC transporter ATP-binding protein [Polyangia bacterium]
MDVVHVEHLQKHFGPRAAVAELSFTVAAGEIYGLLGPNGAGKTTTLRILAGLLAPTGGSARIADVDVAHAPRDAQRNLGFLTGSTGLYGRLTGRETLAYFGALQGLSPTRVAERIVDLTAALDLGGLLDRRAEALSTGQKQRISVARAVLHDPPVLILDEPTVGLDILASRFLRDYIGTERARGKAVIFSTHYLAEAELLCDRIGLMYQGRLLAEGAPAELRARAGGAASLEEAFLRLVAA